MLQTVYWILAASKGWIKQTYRKIMHTQNHMLSKLILGLSPYVMSSLKAELAYSEQLWGPLDS